MNGKKLRRVEMKMRSMRRMKNKWKKKNKTI
jgi:hypothetical protein